MYSASRLRLSLSLRICPWSTKSDIKGNSCGPRFQFDDFGFHRNAESPIGHCVQIRLERAFPPLSRHRMGPILCDTVLCSTLAASHRQSWQHAPQNVIFQLPKVPCRCNRMNTSHDEQQVAQQALQLNRFVPEPLVARIEGWNGEPVENAVAADPYTANANDRNGDQQCIEKVMHMLCGPPQHTGIGHWQLRAASLALE